MSPQAMHCYRFPIYMTLISQLPTTVALGWCEGERQRGLTPRAILQEQRRVNNCGSVLRQMKAGRMTLWMIIQCIDCLE